MAIPRIIVEVTRCNIYIAMASLDLPNDSAVSVATTSNKSQPPPVPPKPAWLSSKQTLGDIAPIDTEEAVQPKSKSTSTSPQRPKSTDLTSTVENADAALQAQGQIEIDSSSDTASVSDAGYASDSGGSSSTSISSSVRDFTFENGRRYHKFREGSYNFPNDDSEQE